MTIIVAHGGLGCNCCRKLVKPNTLQSITNAWTSGYEVTEIDIGWEEGDWWLGHDESTGVKLKNVLMLHVPNDKSLILDVKLFNNNNQKIPREGIENLRDLLIVYKDKVALVMSFYLEDVLDKLGHLHSHPLALLIEGEVEDNDLVGNWDGPLYVEYNQQQFLTVDLIRANDIIGVWGGGEEEDHPTPMPEDVFEALEYVNNNVLGLRNSL